MDIQKKTKLASWLYFFSPTDSEKKDIKEGRDIRQNGHSRKNLVD